MLNPLKLFKLPTLHTTPENHIPDWGERDTALLGWTEVDGKKTPIELPGFRCQHPKCPKFLSGNPVDGMSEIDLQWGE